MREEDWPTTPEGIAELLARMGRRDRVDSRSLSLSAGQEQVEQDRTSAILPHGAELAGRSAGKLASRGRIDRCDNHGNRLASPRLARRKPRREGTQGEHKELAEYNIKRNAYQGEWNYEIHPRNN